MILEKQPMNLSCFQFKQPFEKLEKSPKTVRTYFLMVALSMLSLFFLVIPFEGPSRFGVPLLIVFLITNFLMVLTIRKDPGYIQKSDKISFVKLN